MFNFLKKIINKEKTNIKSNNKITKKQIIFDKNALLVLNKNQQKMKWLLEDFSTTHFLWWWTAISLYLWHRKSIDFDFFNNNTQWNILNFKKRIENNWFSLIKEDVKNYIWIENENQDEFHFIINSINFTTFNFFRTLYDDQKILIKWNNFILWWLKIASKKELLSMKLYAIMTRNKWKDAVDIYFLLKDLKIDLFQAIKKAKNKHFKKIIKTSNILEQLISQKWDKNEKVQYIIKNPPKDKEIVDFLKNEALKIIKN